MKDASHWSQNCLAKPRIDFSSTFHPHQPEHELRFFCAGKPPLAPKPVLCTPNKLDLTFRHFANRRTVGASSSAPNFDGRVGSLVRRTVYQLKLASALF